MIIDTLGMNALEAKKQIGIMSSYDKNAILFKISENLLKEASSIIEVNAGEVETARQNGTSGPMLDRLRLDEKRINGMSDALLELMNAPDPVGRILDGSTRPNGMQIRKVTVPFGVVGMIYESRPNVTVDAGSLAIKSGNAVILRGGKEAVKTNTLLADIMRRSIASSGFDENIVQIITDTSHETADLFMKANDYLDLLIPRGGRSLIKSVVKNATVPVIETGTGNCHIYVDYNADIDMAVDIADNGKTQRPGVCNALESCLVHESAAEKFLPALASRFKEHNVELRGDERTREILGDSIVPVTEEDYATEFLDYIMSVRVVDSLDTAIKHIQKYSTGHSEVIVTNDYSNAAKFQQRIDSACVYVNCSTRFTDGGEFGLGAEIGISTQKLHARGPMGLSELTTYKYLINGSGQVRP